MINRDNNNDLCVGIDLGTTNSALAVINKKPNGDLISKVVDIPRAVDSFAVQGGSKFNMQKMPILPSFVYYQPEANYDSIVGNYAKGMYSKRPHLVAKSIKSQMGQARVVGLSEDIGDKTPAAISARILKHLITNTEKIYHTKIQDAVITVPANFDAAMCKATLEAARIAGIKVTNDDGSEKPVLLSEPNAVIYDLVNQIHNGEIPVNLLNLEKPQNVLVFDIGGGTLDITLHKIKWHDDKKEVLKVDEIATNRYTLLGGDNFDEVLAEEMFKRYLEKYKKDLQVVEKLKKEKASIMAQLRIFAEGLKIDISNQKENSDDNAWGWDDCDNGVAVGGHMGTGYAYDDYFTTEQVEACFETFMGRNLKYSDYENYEQIKDTENIIYPILDVLKKAKSKLQEEVEVNAVILNGGMSKFYMIKDRLKEFFGLDPIIALDPDQAVARGAAVYHYYLHLHEAILREDMKYAENTISTYDKTPDNIKTEYQADKKQDEADKNFKSIAAQRMGIEFGKRILNESLYLGLRNGAQPVELIKAGEELPYKSEVMKGFFISAGQGKIGIPILTKNIDGSMKTIAKGIIELRSIYQEDAFVSFTVSMSESKVLRIDGWVSKDHDGLNIYESVRGDIEIGGEETSSVAKIKLSPPAGVELNVKNEMHSFIQHCISFDKALRTKNAKGASEAANKIRNVQNNIYNCGNKKDFAEPILENLQNTNSNNIKMRLFTLGRKICDYWTESQKNRFALHAMGEVMGDIEGFGFIQGEKVNSAIQAIFTLGKCGSQEQLNKLVKIKNTKLYYAMLYAFGMSGTNVEWIYNFFVKDIDNLLKNRKSHIQMSAYSMGNALRRDRAVVVDFDKTEKIIQSLIKILEKNVLESVEAIPCILALGWICDRRNGRSYMISDAFYDATNRFIEQLKHDMRFFNSCTIASKMMNGENLSEDDEKYLLGIVKMLED